MMTAKNMRQQLALQTSDCSETILHVLVGQSLNITETFAHNHKVVRFRGQSKLHCLTEQCMRKAPA